MATLSLSVQVPAGGVGTTGKDGWREQSSMSQLLENVRRAAEVFADPKVENEVSDDKDVKTKEKVVQKTESIFKKQHRAAGKLTLKERKFEDGDTAERKEVFGEENSRKSMESLEVSKV